MAKNQNRWFLKNVSLTVLEIYMSKLNIFNLNLLAKSSTVLVNSSIFCIYILTHSLHDQKCTVYIDQDQHSWVFIILYYIISLIFHRYLYIFSNHLCNCAICITENAGTHQWELCMSLFVTQWTIRKKLLKKKHQEGKVYFFTMCKEQVILRNVLI